MNAPTAVTCAECGAGVASGGVPLAALYVDPDGHEVDADLAFCTPDHLDDWVMRVRPVAVASSEDEALWRGAPRSGIGGYLGCFLAAATAIAVLVLVAWVVGRLLP
ncbi:MAG: hypothetical protein AB7O74_12260 [Candidatus Nanopelagicales bacterium]